MNSPYAVVSLLDMVPLRSERFLLLMQNLHVLEGVMFFPEGIDPNVQRFLTIDETIRKNAEEIISLLAGLELSMSAMQAERFKEFVDSNDSISMTVGRERVRALTDRIHDEINVRHILVLSGVEGHLFNEKEPYFGIAVNDRFPKAIDDIEDAKKCAALGQGTASVMHLMRIMEVGLKELAATLGIPYAPSWESYLSQIQREMGATHKSKTTGWKKSEKFYRDVSGDLLSVKQAWRNPTMHIDRRYSPEEAREILATVKTLMRRLAEGLPPIKVAVSRKKRGH